MLFCARFTAVSRLEQEQPALLKWCTLLIDIATLCASSLIIIGSLILWWQIAGWDSYPESGHIMPRKRAAGASRPKPLDGRPGGKLNCEVWKSKAHFSCNVGSISDLFEFHRRQFYTILWWATALRALSSLGAVHDTGRRKYNGSEASWLLTP